MITFNIEKPDAAIAETLQEKINNLTKPKGSLGRLEELALQIGLIQQTLTPSLHHPVNVIYASDHGIANEGVSKSPKEVTRQVIHTPILSNPLPAPTHSINGIPVRQVIHMLEAAVSGSVCAYPIVDSAVRMINEMHTFQQAAVTKYF